MLRRILSLILVSVAIVLTASLLLHRPIRFRSFVVQTSKDSSSPTATVSTDLLEEKGRPLVDKAIDTTGSIVKTILKPIRHGNTMSRADIVDATNVERIKAGLAPLRTNIKLDTSAQVKVLDMIDNQYFEHVSPSGKSVADLARGEAYDYVIVGENLAEGDFVGSSDLLKAWMNSPGHRANILNVNYKDIGVYAAQGYYQGHMVWFAVQHFGTERDACPSVDQELKAAIETINDTLAQKQVLINALRDRIQSSDKQGTAYQDMVTKFNQMVGDYNALLKDSKSDIVLYNKQVNKFNSCLAKFNTPAVVE